MVYRSRHLQPWGPVLYLLKRIECLTRDFLTCALPLPLQYISLAVGTAMGDTLMATTTIKVMAAATDIVKDTVKDIDMGIDMANDRNSVSAFPLVETFSAV